ncbi:MAG: hypothetical protein D6818_08450, partial [Bacteroidetes bacterium]
RLDKTLDIRVDESGKMRVPMDELAAGFWRVKVDWQAGGKEYYTETTLIL